MKLITFFIPTLLFLTQFIWAQDVSLSGRWEGYLDQSKDASKMDGYKEYWERGVWKKGQKTHDLSLTFKYNSKKKNYTGEYYINETVNKAHFGRFAFKATFANQKVKYTTTSKIFETKNQLNLGFCYSSATLNYSKDKKYEYLEGSWRGWNDDNRECAGAHVWLRRKRKDYEPEPQPPYVYEKKDTVKEEPVIVKVEKIDTVVEMTILEPKIDSPKVDEPVFAYKDRKVITKESMHIPKDSISIEIWDSNREDGDIISLEFNGQLILQEHTLTTKKKTLRVKLQKGENFITLLAHNLGEIPPNTAALSIERKEGKKVIILESDMDKSESIKIIKE